MRLILCKWGVGRDRGTVGGGDGRESRDIAGLGSCRAAPPPHLPQGTASHAMQKQSLPQLGPNLSTSTTGCILPLSSTSLPPLLGCHPSDTQSNLDNTTGHHVACQRATSYYVPRIPHFVDLNMEYMEMIAIDYKIYIPYKHCVPIAFGIFIYMVRLFSTVCKWGRVSL